MKRARRTSRRPEPAIHRLLRIVRRLRGRGGCAWDRQQTLETLKPQLIEEAYEVLDAIDSGSTEKHAEELGDLLLHVLLQAQIRWERGDFDFDDVAAGLAAKLVRRHPHVFGNVRARTAQEVIRNWEKIKAGERGHGEASMLDGVPRILPALYRAQRMQARAARVGFDWARIGDVLRKVVEETDEVRRAIRGGRTREIREEIGDILFAVVNLARFRGIDAESALRATNTKFERRFREVERRIRARGRHLTESSLAEMDAVWEEIKREERRGRRRRRGGKQAE